MNDLDPDVNYTGAVASRTDQVCASSTYGSVTVKEHFRKLGTHLVACSTYCLRELHAIEKQRLPFPGEPVWKTLGQSLLLILHWEEQIWKRGQGCIILSARLLYGRFP